HGTYGLGIVFRDCPGVIIAARLGSPLVIGVGAGEHFVASDAACLAGHTDKIVYLADHELAVITAGSLRGTRREAGDVDNIVGVLEYQAGDAELGAFPHYMRKEISKQPEAWQNARRGPLHDDDASARLGGLTPPPQQLRAVDRIVLTACGT